MAGDKRESDAGKRLYQVGYRARRAGLAPTGQGIQVDDRYAHLRESRHR